MMMLIAAAAMAAAQPASAAAPVDPHAGHHMHATSDALKGPMCEKCGEGEHAKHDGMKDGGGCCCCHKMHDMHDKPKVAGTNGA